MRTMSDGPPPVEMIRWLFAFHTWAGEPVFAAARAVPQEDAARGGLIAGGPGDGSLHAALAHIAGSEEQWLGRWEGNQRAGIRAAADFASIAAMHDAWRAVQARRAALLRMLTQRHLDSALHYVRGDGQPQAPLMWKTLLHASNHATQHRAEACVGLAMLGHSVGGVDTIDFIRLGR